MSTFFAHKREITASFRPALTSAFTIFALEIRSKLYENTFNSGPPIFMSVVFILTMNLRNRLDRNL